jgi:rare lipoprotein A
MSGIQTIGPAVPARFLRFAMLLILLATAVFLTGCGGPKHARATVPPPPSAAPASSQPEGNPAIAKSAGSRHEGDEEVLEPSIAVNTKALATESGLASWYGPPYHNRRGSNGEIYNMHAMTAAHRTFPLGSIVRVTNIKTGSMAVVRITDRGPFIPGRVIDLSLAAAQKLDVYKPGVAQVRIELLQSPATAGALGKWAVQIGGFPHQDVASKLADDLTRRYHTAKVQRFASPAGDWWIRIRVLDDDHERAQKLAAETKTPEGAVFLVRLD